MRYLIRSALSIGAAALFAGCGGSQPPIGSSGAMAQASSQRHIGLERSSGMPTYKVPGPLLYVGNLDLNITPLAIYPAKAHNPKPIATISKDIDNSSGACIDSDGILYVANYPDSGTGWISEYALGRTKPLRVITKGVNSPRFCAIDGSGNLWITNYFYGGNATEYLKGSTKPHMVITKGLIAPYGIAIDHVGNLYVGNLQIYKTSNIQVYAPGSKSPSRTITDGVTWPSGMTVDAHDTLYVTNFHSGGSEAPGNVQEYRAGQSKPYRTITQDPDFPLNAVVGKNGWLYVAWWPHYLSSGTFAILEYPPHSVKPSSKKITEDIYNPSGLAYYPPLLP